MEGGEILITVEILGKVEMSLWTIRFTSHGNRDFSSKIYLCIFQKITQSFSCQA